MNYTTKQTNQLFLRLKDQILLENEVYKDRWDPFHYGFTLLCDFCFKNDDHHTRKTLIERHIRSVSEVTLSNITEVLLFLHLSKSLDIAMDASIIHRVSNVLKDVATTERLPLSTMGFILLFSKLCPISSTSVEPLENRLKVLGKKYIEEGNIEFALDSLLGTSSFLTDSEITQFIFMLQRKADAIPREKFAKAIIELKQWNQVIPVELTAILESKIDNDFSNWVIPDILFALIESEKLVNSNIPKEHLEEVFNFLKRSGSEWTQMIEAIRRDGVVIDLKHFMRMPALSPVEDVLSLLAIKSIDREFVYQVEESDYQQYVKYRAIENRDEILPNKEVKILVVFVAVESLAWFAVLILNWQPLEAYFNNTMNFVLVPKTLHELFAIITNPVFLGIFLMRWYMNVWHVLIEEKKLSVRGIFERIPLISKLMFKGQ